MSVEHFIAEIERRNLVSDRVAAKLRESAAAPQRRLSAKALARFLVEKKHLSQQQATEVLNHLLSGGYDLDAISPAQDARGAKPQSMGDEAEETILADEANETRAEDDAADSSIFAPYLTGRKKAKKDTSPPPGDRDDELMILPDDEVEGANTGAPTKSTREDDLPWRAPREAPRPAEVDDLSADLDEMNGATTGSARTTTSLRLAGKKKTKRKAKPTKGKKQWDSPLILLGGGGLALLLLCGVGVWWLLNWESADQQLKLARAAVDSGAYTQAIEKYNEFLKGSPRHPQRSLARVQLAMVRIRQATESGNYSAAFDIAQKELKAIEDEEDFDEARGELAALLPQIALGLAQQAEKANVGSKEATQLTELAEKALELCNNVTYLPKPLRDEAKLTVVRETLQRVERHQQTQHALDEGLKAMQQAVADNDTGAAFLAHTKLLAEHPELAGNAALAEMVQKAAAAEQAAIRFVKEEQAAETAERPTPWLASLAIANRRMKPSASRASAASDTAIVRTDGALYGLEAATGRLLWRRHVGHASRAWPQMSGADVLVADTARHELLRLEAATGRLLWRQSIGKPFAAPLVVGERGFIAAASGRLFVIDLNSGARAGYLQFAQPLRVAPAADRNGKRLYLAGDHSILYSISLADLSCLGVYYLGHSEGSITVSPVALMDKLLVSENDGVETSRLRLMSIGEQGSILGQVQERRLTGLATSPPIVAGRRAIVITNRGQIDVYEIGAGKEKDALTLVATRAATGSQPIVRHAALAGRNLWVGDTQLTKFSILPTGNRLPVESIENNFVGATFDQPLALFGDTLVHARRPKSRAGLVVAASDTAQGRILWETDCAMPPAGAPVVDDSTKSLVAANAAGYVFRFDEAAIRSRVQDEPLTAQSAPVDLPTLTTTVDLGQGRAAFCAAGSDRLLLYNPALADGAARWIQLESPLACAVTALGDALVAPITIGQVFYLSSADGASQATPFQPTLQPQSVWHYKPAAAVEHDARRFVIADGRDKVYFVALVDGPPPRLEALAEAEAGPYPIESGFVMLGDSAVAVAESSHLVRFQLPSLKSAGESNLPAPVVWGPFRAGDALLVATADGQMMAVSAAGEVVWKAPFEHGDIAGAPLALADSVLVAYRKGIVERRALADGKPLAATDVEHPLASGPVPFQQRLVVAANDGTLLVLEQP